MTGTAMYEIPGTRLRELRDHAAFMLKMARARGVKIRIPIDNPAARITRDAPGLISRADLP